MSAPRRFPIRRAFHSISFLFGLAALLAPPVGAQPPPRDQTGQWSPAWSWGNTAVHMALLPGPGSPGDHSRVVWWDGGVGASFRGGMWGWSPPGPTEDCQTASSAFTSRPMDGAPYNIFCGGLTHTRDGRRLLVVGGHETGLVVGFPDCAVFDPLAASGSQWTSTAPMRDRRYYASAIRLHDGRPVVLGGSLYLHMYTFGGVNATTGLPEATLRRLGTNLDGTWESSVTGLPPAPPEGAVWSAPVREHSLVKNVTYRYEDNTYKVNELFPNQVLFGGDTLANMMWSSQPWSRLLVRDNNIFGFGSDYSYYFKNTAAINERDNPSLPRSGHVMVPAGDGSLIVFGGRRRVMGMGTPVVLEDVWRLFKDPNTIGNPWTWAALTPSNPTDAPTPRFGAAAIYDPGPRPPNPPRRRILIFGGTVDGMTPADANVYALDVTNPAQPSWSRPAVSGQGPTPRFGHTMEFDNVGRAGPNANPQFRAVLFGGKTGTGMMPNDYSNEA